MQAVDDGPPGIGNGSHTGELEGRLRVLDVGGLADGWGCVVELDSNGNSEAQLFELLREKLYTSVVSDVLDRQGFLDQAMAARIRPIEPKMRLVGRAHTVLSADIYQRP